MSNEINYKHSLKIWDEREIKKEFGDRRSGSEASNWIDVLVYSFILFKPLTINILSKSLTINIFSESLTLNILNNSTIHINDKMNCFPMYIELFKYASMEQLIINTYINGNKKLYFN